MKKIKQAALTKTNSMYFDVISMTKIINISIRNNAKKIHEYGIIAINDACDFETIEEILDNLEEQFDNLLQ